jgi:hypothetical protein
MLSAISSSPALCVGYTIKPIHVLCMDKLVIYQPSPARIFGDVSDLTTEILRIANSMLVKTSLPHLSRKLFPDRKRKTTLDKLRASLHGLLVSRS